MLCVLVCFHWWHFSCLALLKDTKNSGNLQPRKHYIQPSPHPGQRCFAVICASRCHLLRVICFASFALRCHWLRASLCFAVLCSLFFVVGFLAGGWNLLSEDSISGVLPGSFHPAVADGNLLVRCASRIYSWVCNYPMWCICVLLFFFQVFFLGTFRNNKNRC